MSTKKTQPSISRISKNEKKKIEKIQTVATRGTNVTEEERKMKRIIYKGTAVKITR